MFRLKGRRKLNFQQAISRQQLYNETRCFWCDHGLDDPDLFRSQSTFDHIVPQSERGSDLASNLVRACRFCNELRGVTNAFDFHNLAQEVIQPNRHDLSAMAEAFDALGEEMKAKICRTIIDTEYAKSIEEVSIRRWPIAYACQEIDWTLPLIQRDLGVMWHDLSSRIRHTHAISSTNEMPYRVTEHDGLMIGNYNRHGFTEGDTIALVDLFEFRVLKTMKSEPQAVDFRARTGDGCYRFEKIRHGRDRMIILITKRHRERAVEAPALVYATSAAAALRLAERLDKAMIRLPPHKVPSGRRNPLDTRLGVPA